MARSVIYKDLRHSNFSYESDNYKFFFSSMFNLKRFTEKINELNEKIQIDLKAKYRIDFEGFDFIGFVLYKKIEIRGFLVECLEGGEFITCLEEVKLDGRIQMKKKSED